MMNRGPGKKMLQSSSKFEVLAKMVKKACHPVSPSIEKSLARNRENLDIVYQEFYHDYKLYKADVNAPDLNLKDGQGEAAVCCPPPRSPSTLSRPSSPSTQCPTGSFKYKMYVK